MMTKPKWEVRYILFSFNLTTNTPTYTSWQSLAGEKVGLKGGRYARIASGD
jgi:hypothetical protein